MTCYQWSDGDTGSIELCLTWPQVESCSHAGACDADVLRVSHEPEVIKQLYRIPPHALCNYLRGFGAWEEFELEDREQNLQRLLWLACCDIVDNPGAYLT